MTQKKRLVIYQKNVKPIVLSFTSDIPDEECNKYFEEILRSKEISTIETDEDFLILRPSEVTSILISKEKDNSEKSSSKFYAEELKISEENVVK